MVKGSALIIGGRVAGRSSELSIVYGVVKQVALSQKSQHINNLACSFISHICRTSLFRVFVELDSQAR